MGEEDCLFNNCMTAVNPSYHHLSDNQTCYHGVEIIHAVTKSKSCICENGWRGQKCEIKSSVDEDNFWDESNELLFSCGIIAVIISILCFLKVCKKKKRIASASESRRKLVTKRKSSAVSKRKFRNEIIERLSTEIITETPKTPTPKRRTELYLSVPQT